jgi:hypothetical protein
MPKTNGGTDITRRSRHEPEAIDLTCFVQDGWDPRIRPAEATRPWMDETSQQFAYRCLPLNVANAHGWEIVCPCDAQVRWLGGSSRDDVCVSILDGCTAPGKPESLFGQGTVTFHIEGLFRTPPGWNLWVGGSPNRFKDAIQPLTGVVETDWAPFTFTMNWKLTRRNHTVRFYKDEPICFLFPVQRGVIDRIEPRLVRMADAPDVAGEFAAWSKARNAFQADVAKSQPSRAGEQWQKDYMRGRDMRGRIHPDHQTRVRPKPFVRK